MRVLTGIQPSGAFHLGNYFGAIKPLLALLAQADQGFVFIADLHALTTVQDPKALRANIRDAAMDFLACGLDPEKAVFFRQSEIPEHTELLWILSTVCPTGLLERAVSYKEKVQQGITASAGLFTYPVLQAADILLYDADAVPVGKDQKQHLEITRDLAVKFNAAFGETFVVPEPKIREDAAVVPGTDGQKMSKSYGNTIPLFGDAKAIEKAIMRIATDSRPANDPKDPDTCTVYQIHKLFLATAEAKELAGEYRNGLPYGEAKKKLFAAYMDAFEPMRKVRASLRERDVRDALEAGAKRARAVAAETLERARKAVGLK